ncbi:kinase-like protein, partial [Aureobasidium sp. EXF-3399]
MAAKTHSVDPRVAKGNAISDYVRIALPGTFCSQLPNCAIAYVASASFDDNQCFVHTHSPNQTPSRDIEKRAPPRFDAPEGHSWVLGAKLGAGGFGRAYLWNLVSIVDQKVVDRFVLKYTEIRSHQVTRHDQVSTVPILGAKHCSWSLDSWRCYSPYFAFGDLHGLVQAQGPDGPVFGNRREFPEPFAWCLPYRLVSAAVVIDTAFRSGDTEYQVVHVDLKPDNIFLDAPGFMGKNISFPAYPAAYVGDFGCSHITYPGNPSNEAMTFGLCTQGWSAPEISGMLGCRDVWQAPSGSHTNIWQIGYVVQSLLIGFNHYTSDIEWHGYKQQHFVPKYSPPQNTERNYSPELLAILTIMLQSKVDARPMAQEMMEPIKEDMPRFTQGMSAGARTNDESIVPESAPLRGGSRLENATENPFEKFKTPIDRAISPTSVAKARVKAASRKRRRDIVERQIREGLRSELQSTDPADNLFVLQDDLKIKHPQRGGSAKIDYFDAQNPGSTTY